MDHVIDDAMSEAAAFQRAPPIRRPAAEKQLSWFSGMDPSPPLRDQVEAVPIEFGQSVRLTIWRLIKEALAARKAAAALPAEGVQLFMDRPTHNVLRSLSAAKRQSVPGYILRLIDRDLQANGKRRRL